MKVMVIMNQDDDIHEMNQKEVKKYQEFLIEKKKSNLWERISRLLMSRQKKKSRKKL